MDRRVWVSNINEKSSSSDKNSHLKHHSSCLLIYLFSIGIWMYIKVVYMFLTIKW